MLAAAGQAGLHPGPYQLPNQPVLAGRLHHRSLQQSSVGLGVIASGARRVTDAMFVAAARVLCEFSPALSDPSAALYPPLERVRDISRCVAREVAIEAQTSGLAPATDLDELERKISAKMWQLDYSKN